jgi:hypothetical protein
MFQRAVVVAKALIALSDTGMLAKRPFSSLANTTGAYAVDIRRGSAKCGSAASTAQVTMPLAVAIDHICKFSLWQFSHHRRAAIAAHSPSIELLAWLRETELFTLHAVARVWTDRSGAARCILENRSTLSPVPVYGLSERGSLRVTLADSDSRLMGRLDAMLERTSVFLASDADIALLQPLCLSRLTHGDDGSDWVLDGAATPGNGVVEIPPLEVGVSTAPGDEDTPSPIAGSAAPPAGHHRKQSSSGSILQPLTGPKRLSYRVLSSSSQLMQALVRRSSVAARGAVAAQVDTCSLVMHLISLADYDQRGKGGENKLQLALAECESVLAAEALSTKPVVIVINKVDVFLERLRTTPLSVCFPRYQERIVLPGARAVNDAASRIADGQDAALRHVQREVLTLLRRQRVGAEAPPAIDIGACSSAWFGTERASSGATFDMDAPVHHALLAHARGRPIVVLFTSLSNADAAADVAMLAYLTTVPGAMEQYLAKEKPVNPQRRDRAAGGNTTPMQTNRALAMSPARTPYDPVRALSPHRHAPAL